MEYLAQRWILALMIFIAMAITYSTRMALAVTIIKMAPQENQNTTTDECPASTLNGNNTIDRIEHVQYEFDWSPNLQGYIFSSAYIGLILFQIPSGILATRISSKLYMLVAVGVDSLLTLLTPLFVRGNYAATILIIFRIIIGIAESCVVPAYAEIMIDWFPPTERSRCISFVTSGVQLGTFIGAAFSGYLLSTFDGWSSVYYVYGSTGIIWCILFVNLFPLANPDSHPFISDKEKKYLQEMNKSRDKKRPPIPWKDIFSSLNVWAISFAQFAFMFSSILIGTTLARYLTYVLKFPILESGLLSAFPYVGFGIVNIIAGTVADFMINKSYMSRTNVRKTLGFISLIGPPVAMLLASYAECNRILAVCCFVISIGLMGTISPGVRVSCADLSPNFVSLLMTLTNFLSLFGSMIAPTIAAWMTPNSSLLEWKTVFWTNLLVAIPCAIFFSLFASGEVQHWNDKQIKTFESTNL